MHDQNQVALLHILINLIRGLYKSLDDDWRKAAAACGITTAQQHLLWILHFRDGSTLTELSDLGLWHVSTVMNMVDRMEAAGIVRKEVDCADARVKRVFLTAKGNEIRESTEKQFEHFRLYEIIRQLDPDELAKSMKPLYNIVTKLTGEDFVQFIESSAKQIRLKNQ